MPTVSRRAFLAHASGAVLTALAACGDGGASWGLRYRTPLMAILDTLSSREADAIRVGGDLFARAILTKRHCFIHAGTYQNLTAPGTLGLPPVFTPLLSPDMTEMVTEGDVLLTLAPGTLPDIVRRNGGRIVGITTPRTTDDQSPDDASLITDPQRLADSCDHVIHSGIPVWDGVVQTPAAAFPILPVSGIVLPALVGALAGEAYTRSGGIGRNGDAAPATAVSFFATLSKRIGALGGDGAALAAASDHAASAIRAGGQVWVYDGSGSVARELASGCGAPVFIRTVTHDDITNGAVTPGDILVMLTRTSNPPDALMIVNRARAFGIPVLSLCPHDDGGGFRLHRESTYSLDTLSPEQDGVIPFDGGARRFLTTGPLTGLTLLWMFAGEVMQRLHLSGAPIPYRMPAHIADSARHNAGLPR